MARSNQTAVWDDIEGRHCERSAAIQTETAPTSILLHKGGSITPSLMREGWDGCRLKTHTKSSKKAAFTLAEVFLSHFAGRRKIAFTLAEVLITLGIIGIVAAMTLPMLIENHKTRVTVTNIKRAYSILSQACNFARAELGNTDNWGLNSSNNVWNVLDKYMKFDKISESPQNIRLAGGDVVVNYYHRSDGCNYSFPKNNGCGDLNVRIKKYPNQFSFILTKEGFLIPYGTDDFSFNEYKAGRCPGCITGWVLAFENLDFLKCPEKLSWNGKHKCSE